jgi:hypothetical protein
MGREEPGDFQPIIVGWEMGQVKVVWVVPDLERE